MTRLPTVSLEMSTVSEMSTTRLSMSVMAAEYKLYWRNSNHICLLGAPSPGPSSCPSLSLPLRHMILVVAVGLALLAATVLLNCSHFVELLIFGGQLVLG